MSIYGGPPTGPPTGPGNGRALISAHCRGVRSLSGQPAPSRHVTTETTPPHPPTPPPLRLSRVAAVVTAIMRRGKNTRWKQVVPVKFISSEMASQPPPLSLSLPLGSGKTFKMCGFDGSFIFFITLCSGLFEDIDQSTRKVLHCCPKATLNWSATFVVVVVVGVVDVLST